MTEVRYREGLPADANDIIDFQIAMARETEDFDLEREITTKGVHAVFADPSHGRYFVADSGGRVVASLMITYEWSDWRNGMVWWIQSVYVVPDFRRRGIYAGLYQHVKAMVEAELSDGSLHRLKTISAEPGFGFVTLSPHGDDERRIQLADGFAADWDWCGAVERSAKAMITS